MNEVKVTFTLNKATTDLELAMWIIQAYEVGGCTAKQALHIARDARATGTWTAETWQLRSTYATGPWTVEVEKTPDPYADHNRIVEVHRALLKRGSEGDAEAAIAYCKLEYAGEVSHAAMG